MSCASLLHRSAFRLLPRCSVPDIGMVLVRECRNLIPGHVFSAAHMDLWLAHWRRHLPQRTALLLCGVLTSYYALLILLLFLPPLQKLYKDPSLHEYAILQVRAGFHSRGHLRLPITPPFSTFGNLAPAPICPRSKMITGNFCTGLAAFAGIVGCSMGQLPGCGGHVIAPRKSLQLLHFPPVLSPGTIVMYLLDTTYWCDNAVLLTRLDSLRTKVSAIT